MYKGAGLIFDACIIIHQEQVQVEEEAHTSWHNDDSP
jgi:hypothetical protein